MQTIKEIQVDLTKPQTHNLSFPHLDAPEMKSQTLEWKGNRLGCLPYSKKNGKTVVQWYSQTLGLISTNFKMTSTTATLRFDHKLIEAGFLSELND